MDFLNKLKLFGNKQSIADNDLVARNKGVTKSGIGSYDRAYGYNNLFTYNNSTFSSAYYSTVSALYTGVSSIADAACDYEFIVVDEKTLDPIEGEEQNLLSIMNNPNPYENKEKFIKKLVSNFVLEGEAYIYVEFGSLTGNVIKMINVNNHYVTRDGDLNLDGFPVAYQVTEYHEGEYRYTNNPSDNIVRYIHATEPNKMLIVVSDYTPNGEHYYPVSAINAVTSELMQFVQGNTHNNSLLRNGTAIGSVFNYEGELTEEQFERVQNQLRDGFQGAVNAGRPVITEGNLKNIQNITMTNRDMEYKELREQNEKAVYKALKLPLALYMDGSMTFDNMRQARELIHEQATIPPMNYILGEISRTLLPEGQRLIVNEFEIAALRSKRLAQASEIVSGGYLTINEVRRTAGYQPVAGGDILMTSTQPSNSSLATEEPTEDTGNEVQQSRIDLMTKNGVAKEDAERIVNQARPNCHCC